MPRLPLSRLHALWIAAALALPAAAPAADSPKGTQAWVLTFHYGAGNLSMNGDSLDRKFGLGTEFRLGHILDHGFVAGFQSRSWSGSADDKLFGGATPTTSLSRSIQVLTLTGTWYPRGAGVFVRGGAGVCTVRSEYLIHRRPAPSLGITTDDFGFAASAAGGWERRIGRKLGLAADVEYSRLQAPHVKGNLVAYGAGLNYYW
jgi:hypothetical protein